MWQRIKQDAKARGPLVCFAAIVNVRLWVDAIKFHKPFLRAAATFDRIVWHLSSGQSCRIKQRRYISAGGNPGWKKLPVWTKHTRYTLTRTVLVGRPSLPFPLSWWQMYRRSQMKGRRNWLGWIANLAGEALIQKIQHYWRYHSLMFHSCSSGKRTVPKNNNTYVKYKDVTMKWHEFASVLNIAHNMLLSNIFDRNGYYLLLWPTSATLR